MITRRLILSSLIAASLPTLTLAQSIGEVPAARDDGWMVAELAEAGLDPEAMAKLVKMIDAGVIVPNVHALLIEYEGLLVFERYWPGDDWTLGEQPLGYVQHGPTTRHDIRSISKSVTSLLLGIALDEAEDDVLKRPITEFFPDRDNFGNGLDKVTLHHVLTMTAGLNWNENFVSYARDHNDFRMLIASADPIGFVLAREVRDTPGSQWAYNNGLTLVAASVIETMTGEPLADYADKVLFGPLGITDYEWLSRPSWQSDSVPDAAGGLRMRARDMAKIASLVLHEGRWQGRQIVPSNWMATSTARHVQDNPWGPPGVYGYGYYWYPGVLLSGQRVFRASGYGDQHLYVLPDNGLAITLFAGNYEKGTRGIGERILGRIVRSQR